MGNGTILRGQPGIIERLDVSHEWLVKNVRGFSLSKNLCVVTGFGGSMRPMYNLGDPLIIDAGITTVEFDSVFTSFVLVTRVSSSDFRGYPAKV